MSKIEPNCGGFTLNRGKSFARMMPTTPPPHASEIGNLIWKDVQEIASENQEKVDRQIEYALRNLVEPPIKGEITKGKIRWRGLRLYYRTSEMNIFPRVGGIDFTYTSFIELWQRDKRIL